MYTKITIKISDAENACSDENFLNIQILNVVEALNSNKKTVLLDDLIKSPAASRKELFTELDRSSLEYIVNNVCLNYNLVELFNRFVENSDLNYIFNFLLFPKKSLKLIYST